MRVKKVIVPIVAAAILSSQLVGCATVKSKELIEMIDSGQTITVEVSEKTNYLEIKGEQQEGMEWTQLDQLQTYNEFRQGFDEIFNITPVTENNIHSKAGCLYVDSEGDRNGNTTLEDALRNKVFVAKYWNDNRVRDKIAQISSKAYSDLGDRLALQLTGAINAYYNLLPDATNPESFNGDAGLTREEFYMLVYKSEEGVQYIEVDKEFEDAIGGATEYSKFAQNVADYGFLQTSNKSLDAANYGGKISRAEAIYLMVNKHFPEELKKVTGKEKAFRDTKNGGDIALKAKFKEKDKETKQIIEKDRWQTYTLEVMFRLGKKDMQEELYKAMVVAKQLELIPGEDSRWDEGLTRAEAIQLVIDTHLAKNKLYGYVTEDEHGKMNLDKFTIATGGTGEFIEVEKNDGSIEKLEILGRTSDGIEFGEGWTEAEELGEPIDGNTVLRSGERIGDVKILLEKMVADYREWGISEKEIEDEARQLAREYGTTVEELSRVVIRQEDVDAVEKEIEEMRGTGESKGSTTPKKQEPSKPKKETPKKETPKKETPKKETPKKETPKKQEPAPGKSQEQWDKEAQEFKEWFKSQSEGEITTDGDKVPDEYKFKAN